MDYLAKLPKRKQQHISKDLRLKEEVEGNANTSISSGKRERSEISPRSIVEPAAKHARPVYWESGDGRILGPAKPELLGFADGYYWVVLTFEGWIRWIRSDRLRANPMKRRKVL